MCNLVITAARDFETQAHSYVVQVTAKSHLGDVTRNAKVERVARNPSRTATRNFLFHWNKIRRRPLR